MDGTRADSLLSILLARGRAADGPDDLALAPAILGKRPVPADSMLPLGMDVDVHALAP
jgi:hypothetical protein